MKLKNILVGMALLTGVTDAQAQEYLNVYGPDYSQYFPLDEIDSVTIAPSTTMLSSQIAKNERISIYNAALQATGLGSLIDSNFYDETYQGTMYPRFYYTSDFWREIATAPNYRKNGYTLFITPDPVLNTKYGIGSLEDLAAKAKSIYDETYPEDAGLYDDDYTHPKNPLNRYVRYSILKCDIGSLDRLTGLQLHRGVVQGVLGVKTDLVNPTDWYQTLLPHTMMKCEHLTMNGYIGNGSLGSFYINRRYDDKFQIEGACISPVNESENRQKASNGCYFYVNDLVAFTPDVRDKVQDTRIRMDLSTVFPELTTHGIRQNGDPTADDNASTPDETFKNGRNYWFPEGFLDGVTLKNLKNTPYMVYRRPHWNFWSYQGDEFVIFGDYDLEFRLPPVPYSGEWQVRLGFCALPTRGDALIYFDGVQQGDTIDFRPFLDDESILGLDDRNRPIWNTYDYLELTDEQKAAEQKKLKEKGYYRAPYSSYHTDGNVINEFVTNPRTYRRVLCQVYMDNTKDHYLRIQCTSIAKVGNNNEMMLDYIELVPKSVYDVPEGEMEDDL